MSRKKRSKRNPSPPVEPPPAARMQFTPALVIALVAVALLISFVVSSLLDPGDIEDLLPPPELTAQSPTAPRLYEFGDGRYTLWWDEVPADVRRARLDHGNESNILREDYAGPEACRKCHVENYEGWSGHAHRWMNAEATDEIVKGDFSGDASISYLGGVATFYREAGQYRMRLERNQVARVYQIAQTIGSRFTQYYIGAMIAGPEPEGHLLRTELHVLPFGYWIDHHEWIPTVHVGPEVPDGQRQDPFAPKAEFPFFSVYAANCSHCHSTYPFGDWMVWQPYQTGRYTPRELHLDVSDHFTLSRPDLWNGERDTRDVSGEDFVVLMAAMTNYKDVSKHAVAFGITCESCHYGAARHAEGKQEKPAFFPYGPQLHTLPAKNEDGFGRTHDNVNWTCGKCHAGERPYYAGGMATWNSTEYSDAMRGSCYSQLTCITCHNPHQGIGPKWTRTPAQDDTVCLKCHEQYEPADARVAHTHHPIDSSGSRCLNCHMPRINEGMQDLVRTHTIFSPTKSEMIEANQPNACNMCHTDQSIDFTLKHLNEWYGRTYADSRVTSSYPSREQSAALGWLASSNEAVRLVAADALFRTDARWAGKELVGALDDPYLINRQFASDGIERLFGIDLKQHGYRFYMSPEERHAPVIKIREVVGGKPR